MPRFIDSPTMLQAPSHELPRILDSRDQSVHEAACRTTHAHGWPEPHRVCRQCSRRPLPI